VFNFEVQDDHTYFVGVGVGAIWVHNACDGGLQPRTAPLNLNEQLALEEARGGQGYEIMKGSISDPRYAGTHAKMQHVHELSNGARVVIHYWKETATGVLSGFKFK
jgi:hypothetical protein